MKLQPILQAKLGKFKLDYQLNDNDDILFEKFVNWTILKMHNHVAFSSNADLLDDVCIGGMKDTGIDGICVKIDGRLVTTIDDIKTILENNKNIEIEFIFVQSKHNEHFEQAGILKFLNGVKDFLDETQLSPSNEDIKRWLEVKQFLFSDDVVSCWKDQPTVRVYYVSMGIWNADANITSVGDRFKQDVVKLNTYGQVFIDYIDAASLKKICDENENNLTINLKYIGSLSPETRAKDVTNFYIAVASADEFMKVLVTKENIFRSNLFEDNVRGYQGDTYVNLDISETIKNEPQNFSLYNNGITIVCKTAMTANGKLAIESPQIVNGCQTCNSLYTAMKNGIDISAAVVLIKVIATQNENLTNGIVRGTNRQNIVYDEAFEITKPFHKNMEDFFEAQHDVNGSVILFYERRSKQYPNIPPHKKAVFKQLIQSFVSTFLSEPHNGHLHENKLLQIYQNKIFIPTQSYLPYYVSTLTLVKFEAYMRQNGGIYKTVKSFKMQILYIFFLLNCGQAPDINQEKNVDKYANSILALLERTECDNKFKMAIDKFAEIRNLWVKDKGRDYRFAIKDSKEFSEFATAQIVDTVIKTTKLIPIGKILNVGVDRYGHYYGFISKNPTDIFFHSSRNPDLDFKLLEGKNVTYEVLPAQNEWQREQAINVKVV